MDNQKSKLYTLLLNEEQLTLVQEALDLYRHIRHGKWGAIIDYAATERYYNYHFSSLQAPIMESEQQVHKVFLQKCGLDYLGIPADTQIDDDQTVMLWNIYLAIWKGTGIHAISDGYTDLEHSNLDFYEDLEPPSVKIE